MICVVDASVAVKWFAQGDWALREDNIEPALEMLKASTRGTLDFYQPPHFWQKLRQCYQVWRQTGHNNVLMIWLSSISLGQRPPRPTPEPLNWRASLTTTCSTRFTTQLHCLFRARCW